MWQNNPLGCPQPLGSRPLLLGPPFPARLGGPRGGGQSPRGPKWSRSSQALHPARSQPVPTSSAGNAQVAVSPRTSLLKFPCVHRPGPPRRLATCMPPNPRDQPRAPRRERGSGDRTSQSQTPSTRSPCNHSAASSRSPRPCMAGGGVRAGCGSEPTGPGGRGEGAPCSGWLWSCPRL